MKRSVGKFYRVSPTHRQPLVAESQAIGNGTGIAEYEKSTAARTVAKGSALNNARPGENNQPERQDSSQVLPTISREMVKRSLFQHRRHSGDAS